MKKSASESEYLLLTGLGISDMKITQKAIVFPYFRTYYRLGASTIGYNIMLNLTSTDHHRFSLLADLKIGPSVDKLEI